MTLLIMKGKRVRSSKYLSTVSTAGVALALSLAAGQASAQTEVEEIVVTGSFIAGTPEDAALPLSLIHI